MSDDPGHGGGDPLRRRRLRFRSRRGLLELELLLQAFVAARLDDLPAAQLAELEALFEEDDADVHDWLLARSAPPPALRAIVELMRAELSLPAETPR
jgi:antitoxin CptB